MPYAHSDSSEAVLANPAPDVKTRQKLEGGKRFTMATTFEPAGDQPTAIAELSEGVREGERDQVLLGATGTGKTFTMAKIIEETQRPAIILAPNKTLAAQLYGEFKGFFPDNAVEYFVSYYDYYQPEAYVARSDTYIEKESQINEQIDRMRHSATRALLERDDVIIVASVSCIYGIGSVETYGAMTQDLKTGESYDQRKIMADLVAQQYKRNDQAFQRGSFRVRGDTLEIFPAHLEDRAWRLSLLRRGVGEHHRIRPAHRRKDRHVRPDPRLRQQPLRDPQADDAAGHHRHQERAAPTPRSAGRRGQTARGAAAGAAHQVRSGDAGGDRRLQRHRELFTLPDGPRPRRAAPHPLRVHPRQRHRLRRRIPRFGPADRRHVQGRLPAQVHAGRARLSPAVLHGQPPPQVRGVGRDAPAIGVRLRHPRQVGDRADRRRLHRTGDPPHRAA